MEKHTGYYFSGNKLYFEKDEADDLNLIFTTASKTDTLGLRMKEDLQYLKLKLLLPGK
ncbi:MAG: hypothetical protein R6U04_11050 [Bacteroidales bacterium]